MRTHGKKVLSILLSALLLCTLFAPVTGLFAQRAEAAVLPDFASDYLLGQYYSLNWDAEGYDIWSWYDGALGQYNGLQWCGGDGYATYNSEANGYYIHNAYVRIANNDLFRGVNKATGLTVAFRYIPDVANDHRHILSLGANEYSGSSNANNHFYISATKSWRENANGNSYNTVPFIGYVDENGAEHINACPPASAPAFATGTAYDVVVTVSATEGIKYNINGVEYNAVYLNSSLDNEKQYIEAFLNAVSGWRYNYIGCSRWADGNFSGWLKNLRIYGKAFSKAQLDQSADDYFTANYDALAANANADFSVSMLDKPVFMEAAYHCADEAVNGYNNLVYAAVNDTNWGYEYEQDNSYYTLAMPNYTVMVYDGVEGHTPKSPIYLQRKGDRALDYMAVNLNGNDSVIRFDGNWVGYTDENYNNWQGYQLWPYVNPQTGPNYIDYLIRDRDDLHRYMTSNQGNSTRRGYGNALVYHGTGNTDTYFEAFMNLPMKYSHTYWGTSTQVNAYDNIKATGTILVLNYKPVYDILDAAKNFYNTQIKDQEWKYTEASLDQALTALYLLGKCNPNNYTYNNTIAGVKQCAREIKLALAEYEKINLVKKTGNVIFQEEDGTPIITIPGVKYGEGVPAGSVPSIPAKDPDETYHYINAHWDTDFSCIETPELEVKAAYTAQTHDMVEDPAVAPTCAETGLTAGSHCSGCGYTIPQTTVAADTVNGHSYGAWVPNNNGTHTKTCTRCTAAVANHAVTEDCASVAPATCNALAVCDVCGAAFGNYGEHAYGTWIEEQPAGCSSDGVKGHYHCAVCGKDFDADYNELTDLTIPAAHAYGTLNAAVTPDCTTPGNIAYYECSVCHHTFNEAFEEVADVTLPAGHTYGEWINETPATCAAAGEKGHYHCSGCQKDFDAAYAEITDLVIPKAAHQYGSFAPNGNGTHTKTCANCPAEAEGHSVTEDCSEGTPATCEHKAVCGVCGGEYGELAAHTYGEWIDETPATCTENGVKGHYHCAGCQKDFDADYNEINDLTIPAGHTYGEWINETPATCTENGVKGHYRCAGCQKDFDADHNEINDLTIPAGHTYGEWIAETPASCAAAGEKAHYHCAGCQKDFDADYTEIADLVIPKEEHVYGGWAPNGNGTHTKTCPNCPAEAEGHAVTEACAEGTPATCEHKAVCGVCGGEYGDLAAHTTGGWIAQTAPGCTTPGEKGHYHCSVCGKDLDADYNEIASLTIPAAHHPVFVAEVPATETETGVIAHYDCSVCGKHFRESACVHELFDDDMVIPATGSDTPVPAGEGVCKFCGQYHDSSVWGRVSSFVHLVLYLVMMLMGKI